MLEHHVSRRSRLLYRARSVVGAAVVALALAVCGIVLLVARGLEKLHLI